MTLSQLATLNKVNDGHFFNRDTMAHFGDTMKSFSIKTNKKANTAVVTRKTDGRKWTFDTKTGRLVYAVQFSEKLDGMKFYPNPKLALAA